MATAIKNKIDDRLKHIFIIYTSNKEIKNQIKHRLEMPTVLPTYAVGSILAVKDRRE
jgi:hypothetical protein